jgi:peptidoglycan/LPS O-acetylase OafA/YrhL
LKYRAEIDGLRAIAVIPVILFHAGFELFSGGFIGVDIFFVISGYLITTILIEDIENNRFSIINFYERRVRRIIPALFFVSILTSIYAYRYLFPSALLEYSESLIYVIIFASNIFFWRVSDYFSTEADLTPLLHTWSLAVEEQYYMLFPIFLFLTWRFGKNRVFWMIVMFTAISLALSEWGWRNKAVANFYLAPTRACELFAGSIAAFIVQKRGIQANNTLSLIGLAAIILAIFAYDGNIPLPSIYVLLPVVGVVLLILFAEKETLAAKLLSTKAFVGIGLISYSAYLWHQPLFAFTRLELGVQLPIQISFALVLTTISLAIFSWKYIEQPFRSKNFICRKSLLYLSTLLGLLLLIFASLVLMTEGARYRFPNLPSKPSPSKIKCHESKSEYSHSLSECLGISGNGKSGDIFLIGDSHASQLTFALQSLANSRGVDFYTINTPEQDDFPHSFLLKSVESDRLLEHVLDNADIGDIFVTSFHRGHFNNRWNIHIKMNIKIETSGKSQIFFNNMMRYLPRFEEKGLDVYLVKDGPMLSSNSATMLELCMHKYMNGNREVCPISIDQDLHTRERQSVVFDQLADEFENVVSLDYLPVLYGDEIFSPISDDGAYLMFDQNHLTETASLLLFDFFDDSIKLNRNLKTR